MPGTGQDTPLLSDKRENVTGHHEIARCRVTRNCCANGSSPIGSGDARGDAIGCFDGHGKVRFMLRGVAVDH